MSPLTKAFVVVVAVLSILLVALVVPFVAKTQNYQEVARQTQTQLASAEQRNRSLQAELTAAQSKESERVIGLNNQVSELTGSIQQLQTQLADEQIKSRKAAADLAQRDADIASLAASAKQQTQLLDAVSQELNSNRSDLVKQQSQVIELVDRNNELNAQLAGLTRQVQRFQEASVVSQEELDALKQAIGTLPRDVQVKLRPGQGTGAIVPTTPITGKVSEVRSAGGVTLAEINVGKNDKVQEGMEFTILRGDSYLATLVVEQVDASRAAGRITLEKGAIQPGDDVFAGPI